jgi:hypothetical protein
VGRLFVVAGLVLVERGERLPHPLLGLAELLGGAL